MKMYAVIVSYLIVFLSLTPIFAMYDQPPKRKFKRSLPGASEVEMVKESASFHHAKKQEATSSKNSNPAYCKMGKSNPYYKNEVVTEAKDKDFDEAIKKVSFSVKKGSELYYAIIKGNKDAFMQELEAVNVDDLALFRNYPRKETLAHVALARNRTDMFHKIMEKVSGCAQKPVDQAIEISAYVNAQQYQGHTLVHYAVAYQNKEALDLLLQHYDADIHIHNKHNFTPYQLALKLEHGPSEKTRRCFGIAPLTEEQLATRRAIVQSLTPVTPKIVPVVDETPLASYIHKSLPVSNVKQRSQADCALFAQRTRHYIEQTFIPCCIDGIGGIELAPISKKAKRDCD